VSLAADPPVLELRSISLTRGGRTILDRVDLSILKPGEVCGLLGANGAGKTSLLKVITGLLRADKGSVSIQGEVSPPGRMPTDMGALIEEPRFYPWLSARDNLAIAAGGRPERLERIDHLLAIAGLEERARERVSVYSQGMRQRLGIARALLGDPAIVLFDEPSNGLDPEGIAWLRALLVSLRTDGKTVLVASHVLAEIQRICQMVVVMGSGRIIAEGPMVEILAGFSSVEDLYFSLSDSLGNDQGGFLG
jgi:ABC-2 type transport system ATP-binding protein